MGGDPGEECGQGNGALVGGGGRDVSGMTGLFSNKGWEGSSGEEVGEQGSGDGP